LIIEERLANSVDEKTMWNEWKKSKKKWCIHFCLFWVAAYIEWRATSETLTLLSSQSYSINHKVKEEKESKHVNKREQRVGEKKGR
jgi:hypothetical protein